MTKRKLMGMALAAVLAVPSAEAANWTIYPGLHKPVKDGVEIGDVEMTGPQQITNAMTQAVDADTLRVTPGTYDFTGISMLTESFTKDNVTYTVTNHIYYTHSVHIIGYGTTGRWSDEVVFRGDGTGRCLLLDQYWGRSLRNITFENFNAGSYPDTITTDLHTKSNGGAVQCIRGNASALAISNCVFRNCRAANGGAVHGGGLQDCLFTNNVAFKNGGAVVAPGAMVQNCEFRGNQAYGMGACYLASTAAKVRDCIFEGNASVTNGTFYFGVPGCSVSNCTFVGNCCTSGNGGVVAGGNSNVPFLDCVFSNNWAALAGGAFNGSSTGAFFTNCVFVGNSARCGTGGAVSFGASAPVPVFHQCVFKDNWATNYNGGAIRSDYGARVTSCAFTNNVAYGATGGAIWCCNRLDTPGRFGTVLDSDFFGNYGNNAGATYGCNVSNCTFTANRCTHRGGAMYYGNADDCRFYDNYKQDKFGLGNGIHQEYGGGCATAATLTRCEITDGSLWSCALTDCHIHDYPSTTGLGCVFYEGNWATNCLIENCACGDHGVCYNYGTRYAPGVMDKSVEGARALFTHCTFADNTLHNNGGFFSGHSGKRPHPVTFEGCILSGNKKKNGTEADISGYYVSTASQTHYRNCLYGADDGTFKGEDGLAWVDDGGLVSGTDPRFVAGAKKYPDAPYYALRPGSSVRGKGDATIFSDEDVDLAGNPRKRDGKLDLGCYQCWLDPIGAVLLFR